MMIRKYSATKQLYGPTKAVLDALVKGKAPQKRTYINGPYGLLYIEGRYAALNWEPCNASAEASRILKYHAVDQDSKAIALLRKAALAAHSPNLRTAITNIANRYANNTKVV